MRKVIKSLCYLSFVMSLLFITGCSEDELEIALGSITGVVTDKAGNPVEGATVTLMPDDKTTTTESTGKYIFNDLPSRQYDITVEKDGYDVLNQKVSVIADKQTVANLELIDIFVVNFNGLLIEPDTEYRGPKEGELPEFEYYYFSKFTDPTESVTFTHYVPKEGTQLGGGFTYTNKDAHQEDKSYTNSGAITGKGVLGKTYLTAYSNDFTPGIITLKESKKVKGCYITNSTYAYMIMKEGGGFTNSKPFTDKDYFKLIIIGKLESKEMSKVEFYLAKDGKIVDEWTWVDLTELGNVDELHFDFESTDMGDHGINTPTYFCMDALSIYF